MTDISHILPFEAFVILSLLIMGAIVAWAEYRDNNR